MNSEPSTLEEIVPYLYHNVPLNLKGTVLYPLNELRKFDEAIYRAHAQKYAGREGLMQRPIPLLNCLWNDVLFFTAVHPRALKHALEAVGYVFHRPSGVFEFALTDFDPSRLAVFVRPSMNEKGSYKPFDATRFEEYAQIPQATIDFWRSERALGKPTFWAYQHIPHILYRGTLDTARTPRLQI